MIANFFHDLSDDWQGLGSKARRDVWFAVILILIFSQFWLAPIFGYGDKPPDGLIIRSIWYPVHAFIAILCALYYRNMFSAVWRTPLLMWLLGLTALSMMWSIDPAATLRRSIAVVITTAAGYAIATRFSWQRLTEVLGFCFIILIILCLFMVIVFPSLGKMVELFPGAWRGVWPEKNSFGSNMAMAFAIFGAAALHNEKRKWFWLFWAGFAALLVLLSTSKTSLLSLLIAFGIMMFIVLSRRGPIMAILMTWAGVSMFFITTIALIYDPGILLKLLGKDSTLTGRTVIWGAVKRLIAERPNEGYGFGVIWMSEGQWAPIERIKYWTHFRPFHAHSTWLGVWLDLGLIGLVSWSLVFVEAWIKALWRCIKGDGGYFALAFLGITSLISISEFVALGWNELRWVLFCLVLVKLSLPFDENADGYERRHS